MTGRADTETETERVDDSERLSRGLEAGDAGDLVLLALAAVDVLLLFALDVYAAFLPATVDRAIVVSDLVLVGVFALAFVVDLGRASDPRSYVRTHWYDLVGLVPIAHWALRGFRLVGLLRIYVVRTRSVDPTSAEGWPDALARLLLVRYRDVQVEEIADPIVLATIRRLRGPIVRARWTGTIAGSLASRRSEIRASVGDALAQDPRVGRLARTGPGRRLVDEVTGATLDATIQTLGSEEVNDVVAHAIDGVLEDVHRQVEEGDP